MGSHPDYIRVGVTVSDTGFSIVDIRALAFVSSQDDDAVKAVIHDETNVNKITMFNPYNGESVTDAPGGNLSVVAFITSDTGGNAIDRLAGTYYPYVYTKNSGGYEKVTAVAIQSV